MATASTRTNLPMKKSTGCFAGRGAKRRWPLLVPVLGIMLLSGLFSGLYIGGQTAHAQTVFEERRNRVLEQQLTTRNRIQTLESQIQRYRERLTFATQRFEQTYEEYTELTRLIALQKERIRQISREGTLIREEIDLVEDAIRQQEAKLERLITRYKQTLTYLYKYGRTTDLALLMSSSSINQLLIRSYYLEQFDSYQKEQAALIREAQAELEAREQELAQAEAKNQQSKEELETQTQELETQEAQLERNVTLLQRDRENVQEQLKIYETQRQELNGVMDRLLEEEAEIRRAEEERLRRLAEAQKIENEIERRAAVARYSTPTVRENRVTDEELEQFTNTFAQKRGSLPWPVDRGVITEKFGVRVHPVIGTRTNHPGIQIAVEPNSSVRVVTDGVVYRVMPIQGFGDVVFVNHGDYNTAYGNLSNIYVRRNQVLRAGDVIGLSGDQQSILGEAIFFLIREGSSNVDPERWLSRPIP